METMSEAIARLTKLGYSESFRARNGLLETASLTKAVSPSECRIDTVVRFEGDTNLEDESAIFALTHPGSGVKGLYIVAFGPEMDTLDLSVVQKLGKS